MSEINSVEPTTNQTTEKQNWCGIIGSIAAIVALILMIVAMNIDTATVLGVVAASGVSALISLIFSIIGLFFKPRKFAVAGLIISFVTIILFIAKTAGS